MDFFLRFGNISKYHNERSSEGNLHANKKLGLAEVTSSVVKCLSWKHGGPISDPQTNMLVKWRESHEPIPKLMRDPVSKEADNIPDGNT